MFFILNSDSAAKNQYLTRLGLNSGSLRETALPTLIFGTPGSARLARWCPTAEATSAAVAPTVADAAVAA
jgi:hypothetical protein